MSMGDSQVGGGEVRIRRVIASVPAKPAPPTQQPQPEAQNVETGVVNLEKFQNQAHRLKPPGAVIKQFGYLPDAWIKDRLGEMLALADTHIIQFCTALSGALGRKVRVTDEIGGGAFLAVMGSDTSLGAERLVANFTASPNDVGHNALAAQLTAKPPAVGQDFLHPLTLQTDQLVIPPSVARGASVSRSVAQRAGQLTFPDQSNIQANFGDSYEPFRSLVGAGGAANIQQASVPPLATTLSGGAAGVQPPAPLATFNPPLDQANHMLAHPSVPITAGDMALDALNRDSNRPESPRRAKQTIDDAIVATGDADSVLDAMTFANQTNAPVALQPNGHAHVGGSLAAISRQTMVVDPRENIQISTPHGGTQTIFNPRDGATMGAHMLGRGGNTDADLQLFNTVYQRPHPHHTHQAQQRLQRLGSRANDIQATIMALSRSGVRNREQLTWDMLPEHLGMVFLTDEVVYGIGQARDAVNTRRQLFTRRPPSMAQRVITAYDLMTHHATLHKFAELTHLYIQKKSGFSIPQNRTGVQDKLYLDNQIALKLWELSKLCYTMDGRVVLSEYTPDVHQQRLARMAVPRPSDIPTFSSLYSMSGLEKTAYHPMATASDSGVYDYVMSGTETSSLPTPDQVDAMRYHKNVLRSLYGDRY